MNLTVRRYAALGDTLAASVVAQALKEQGYSITWQCLPEFHPVMKRCKWVDKVESCVNQPNINLDFDYRKHPMHQIMHLYDLFFTEAQRQFPDIRWKPGLRPMLTGHIGYHIIYEKFKPHPEPWVMVCPRSEHYVMRQVPDGIWYSVAQMRNYDPSMTFFWIGQHPSPPGYVDLKIRNLEMLIDTIACADLLVTVDTGPMHIAAALDIPIVAIHQAVNPALRLPAGCGAQIVGREDLNCLNCQKTLCPINATQPPCQEVPVELIVGSIKKAIFSNELLPKL